MFDGGMEKGRDIGMEMGMDKGREIWREMGMEKVRDIVREKVGDREGVRLRLRLAVDSPEIH